MKTTSKKNDKNKINFLKPGFIIPMVYCTVSALIMAGYYLVNKGYIADTEFARTLAQAGTISILLSPSALMICGRLSMKHREKYPFRPFFYTELPVYLSFLILGLQVFYLVSASM